MCTVCQKIDKIIDGKIINTKAGGLMADSETGWGRRRGGVRWLVASGEWHT